MLLPSVNRRVVEVDFKGGHVTSNGGSVLLRQIDRKLRLTEGIARRLPDPRQKSKVSHSMLDLLRQRVYSLACGDEDLNDHHALRHDLALQTAIDCDSELASPSTLCRFENWATGFTAQAIHEQLVETFISSHKRPPRRIVLDFDSTPAITHGQQEQRFFHGFYDEYCFLPLYVFAGNHLLTALLRPADRDGAYKAGAVLRLLVKRFRQVWPKVEIVFRADSGFCRPKILGFCDRNDVKYIVGIATNSRLQTLGDRVIRKAKKKFKKTKAKVRLFQSFKYKAHSWDRSRRVIMRMEYTEKGSNPRFIVTNLKGGKRKLYEKIYCERGDAENRIKEQKSLFATRVSCHDFAANQLRVLLAGLAYTLLNALREQALSETKFKTAMVEQICLKLMKIGGVLTRNSRRVRLMLSSSCPHQVEFRQALKALSS